MKVKPFVAELIATYCFVLVGVGSIVAAASTPGSLGPAFAHGIAIAVLASATMHISGGQLNPAVTLAVWLGNEITLRQAVANIFGQVAGSVAALYTLSKCLVPEDLDQLNWGIPALGTGVSFYGGFALEAIFTFILVLTVFGTAVDKRASRVGGLYIGFAVLLGGLAIGPFTGACLNPARYIGPAIMNADWQHWLVYTAGPILGGAVAALIYTYGIGRVDKLDLPGEGEHA